MDMIIVFLAKYLIWLIVAAAVVLLGMEIYKTRNFKLLGFIVLAALTTLLIDQLFHLIPVEVYRPYQLQGVSLIDGLEPSPDSPFPSDHVALAFGATFMIIIMTRYKKIGLILLLAAFGVLAGRLLALVHSPLDVVGGVVCACLGAIWYYIYYRYYNKDNKKSSNEDKKISQSKEKL